MSLKRVPDSRGAFFIDDQIYFQGKKQLSRKVYCLFLEMDDRWAYFTDESGNRYCLPIYRIFFEDEVNVV